MNRRQFFTRVAGAAVATQMPLPAVALDITKTTYPAPWVMPLRHVRNMAGINDGTFARDYLAMCEASRGQWITYPKER